MSEPAQRFTINRIEQGYATLETKDNRTFEVPEAWLPEEAVVGDSVCLRGQSLKQDSALHFFIDLKGRQAQLKELEAIMQDLLEEAKATTEPPEPTGND